MRYSPLSFETEGAYYYYIFTCFLGLPVQFICKMCMNIVSLFYITMLYNSLIAGLSVEVQGPVSRIAIVISVGKYCYGNMTFIKILHTHVFTRLLNFPYAQRPFEVLYIIVDETHTLCTKFHDYNHSHTKTPYQGIVEDPPPPFEVDGSYTLVVCTI